MFFFGDHGDIVSKNTGQECSYCAICSYPWLPCCRFFQGYTTEWHCMALCLCLWLVTIGYHVCTYGYRVAICFQGYMTECHYGAKCLYLWLSCLYIWLPCLYLWLPCCRLFPGLIDRMPLRGYIFTPMVTMLPFVSRVIGPNATMGLYVYTYGCHVYTYGCHVALCFQGYMTECHCGAPRLQSQLEFIKVLMNIGKRLSTLPTKELRSK